MADNIQMNPAIQGSNGPNVRAIDAAGVKTIVACLNVGTPGAETLLSSSSPIPIGGVPVSRIGYAVDYVNASLFSGAKKVTRVRGSNYSATTAYLMLFDATTLPADGTAPIWTLPVPFGIPTAPTVEEAAILPNYISVSAGVYGVWSSTLGTLTKVSNGTGLTMEAFGY